MAKTIAQLHWDYFFLLEKDLITILETLELSKANYPAFGPRIVQLILSAGSELDVSLKDFARALSPKHEAATKEKPNMGDFRTLIQQHAYEQFSTASVKFLHSEIVLTPWKDACTSPNKSIRWWTSYNNVKHKRSKCYQDGNLETALELIAALMVVNAYLSEATLDPPSGFTRIIDWEHHEHLPQIEGFYADK